jgi:hypothetical protein
VREYETKLLAREEENAEQELAANTAVSEAFERISNLLRQLLHVQNGEDVEPPSIPPSSSESSSTNAAPASSSPSSSAIISASTSTPASGSEPGADSIPFIASDYALEREIELARLERENEELRRMAGLLPAPRREETTASFEVAPLQRFPVGRTASQVGPSPLSTY